MTDAEALLRAIFEHPDEDTPRLVFADWLDEHADTFAVPEHARQRALFIRADTAAARLDENAPARLRWELIEKPRREEEAWLKATYPPELLSPERSGGALRRGFPWWVRLAPAQFLANASHVLALAPAPALSYSQPDAAIDALGRSPRLGALTGLHVRQAALGPVQVQRLAHSPHAARLEWLSAGHDGLTARALPVLVRSPLFPRLRRLDVEGRRWVAPALLRALAGAGGTARLRELGLAESGLTGEHLPRLLTAPALEHVERLRLASNRLGAAGHAALASLPPEKLRRLDLSETAPGAEGVRVLFGSLTLSRLERLGYRRNHLNAALLTELAGCPEVRNLKVLDLANNAVGSGGAAALVKSPHLAGLLVLNLSYCMVGDEGIGALLGSPLAETLVLLDLTGSPASPETKEALKARMGDRVRV
ncbi:MAG: TIGR02996 domain-containing protein [Gemmata sp.]